MDDTEMLRKCREAFSAMRTADEANRFLKQQGDQRRVYAASGQHKLRRHMLDCLEQHLGTGKYSS